MLRIMTAFLSPVVDVTNAQATASLPVLWILSFCEGDRLTVAILIPFHCYVKTPEPKATWGGEERVSLALLFQITAHH